MYPPEIGGKMPEKRKKGQHLTWENRQEIQLGLKNHLSFAAIADVIGCSPDTISKEIRKHRYFKERTKTAGNYNRVNDCKYKDTCKKRNLCNKKKGYHCRIQCKKCYKCMTLCDAYKPYVCPIEHKAPYVCNACEKSATCRYDKYLYNANCAHHEYLETLKSSREGIDMTKAELIELDELISPL
ncbi:transposase [human gut metagenome]|uniref:Transposase n=1 Tax=human gut metagenome TaxID=408170 RepID=K1SUF9_9ZZZZ